MAVISSSKGPMLDTGMEMGIVAVESCSGEAANVQLFVAAIGSTLSTLQPPLTITAVIIKNREKHLLRVKFMPIPGNLKMDLDIFEKIRVGGCWFIVR